MLETIRTVARRDRRSVPWSNRRGMTSEIVRGTPTQSGAPSWRLSVASLRENADFSPLRDIDRIFTVVGNVGTTLHFADHDQWAAPLAPCAFAGEDSPFCEITTPTEAFNVMVERTAATASVTSLQVITRADIHSPVDSIMAVFVADGSGRLDRTRLTNGDCVICHGGSGVFRGSARLLIVEIMSNTGQPSLEPLGIATTPP
ncbi:HutD/Ves family protein [Nocardia gipuzkoensis]